MRSSRDALRMLASRGVMTLVPIAWRKARATSLTPEARRLLVRVERAGRLRVDDRALAKAKAALEKTALVRAFQEHTEEGHHATVLESWSSWAPTKVARAASALDLDGALAVLRAAGVELASRL